VFIIWLEALLMRKEQLHYIKMVGRTLMVELWSSLEKGILKMWLNRSHSLQHSHFFIKSSNEASLCKQAAMMMMGKMVYLIFIEQLTHQELLNWK
jgi:hypothetical protein